MYQDLLKKQLKYELLRVQIFWFPGNNKAADKLHHSLRKTGLVYPGFKKKNIFLLPGAGDRAFFLGGPWRHCGFKVEDTSLPVVCVLIENENGVECY